MLPAMILLQAVAKAWALNGNRSAMTRQIKFVAVLGVSIVALGAPATAADPGSELNNVLRYYREAEQKIRPDAALHRSDDGSESYDESGATKAIDAQRRAIEEARTRLDRIDFS